ncbi:FAD-binding UDP-N-acetylenolpyruvoylglucosamine reductase [Wigglesworthia glossinidia endosymbiont of Glossina morsitans morsitans (Yale colony)]|uniref:UDP-N-acetylenolpyruvoylglucosamine reductase n=1 Tax=Wigglesworthia glossinidia endosymbiont of Glossina morsitans morsitans (Yale colony) TaxID=1142511 RepID=H6Q4M5_WIGGL|nr:FAD-binding UDP-N-acetylenolpyruvoylglucosamine reductase [Wigglesworthia glossinidia endosymbiont of Glossina morsitans morsitans (Yale colony)]
MFLGSGSNVLFLEKYYQGIIILNRIRGFKIIENISSWNIHVCAGEVWNNIVTMCLKRKIPGLENLALIPGYVGAAPIQNIGAYGMELSQICTYVDILLLETGKKIRLHVKDCSFGYRSSIFNTKYFYNYSIVAIGLQLKKKWKACLNYSGLSYLRKQLVTPRQIYKIVCWLRQKKIPNPKHFGNAGSFFKNPVISIQKTKDILNKYPHAPCFNFIHNKFKFSAGWMIDSCGLKGFRLGRAAVHHKQAAIIINTGFATGYEILNLAHYIFLKVKNKFFILLESEVQFISKQGKIDSSKIIT